MTLGMKKESCSQVALCFVFAILVSVPLLTSSGFIIQLFFVIFCLAGLGQSWNIMGGYCGYASMGHAMFIGAGGYTTAILTAKVGLSPLINIPTAGLVAALLGLVIGIICFRIRGPYFLIVTLSITFVLQALAMNLQTVTDGNSGISLPLLPVDARTERMIFYYVSMLFMVATAFSAYKIERLTFGLEFRSIREDGDVSEAMGVNTFRAKLVAIVLSAFLTGMLGVIYTWQAHFIDPNTGFDISKSIYAILIPALGGTGMWFGPILGGVIIAVASTAMAIAIPSVLNVVLFGLILILIIRFLPDGILWGVERQETKAVSLMGF